LFIVLDTEAFFTVVTPVTYVLAGANPFVSFDATIFTSFLLLYPENSSVRAILLCLCVVYFPEVDEGLLLLALKARLILHMRLLSAV